jgi:hypothetical protein
MEEYNYLGCYYLKADTNSDRIDLSAFEIIDNEYLKLNKY